MVSPLPVVSETAVRELITIAQEHSARAPACSTGQAQSAEQVEADQNDQEHTDNPDASTRTPPSISVISAAAAEQQQ
jgi:hypothetical protein